MSAKTREDRSWFVVDAPVDDVALDAFGHDDIADNLHRMVVEPTSHRRMIGLFGQFGVGKSTVIELLRAKLRGRRDLGLIRISAERHEPVGFHRAAVYAFAEALVSAGQVTVKEADEILEPLRSAQSTSISDVALSPLGRLATQIQSALNISKSRFLLYVAGAIVVAGIAVGVLSAVIPAEWWKNISGFVIPMITTTAFFGPFIWLGSSLKLGSLDVGGLFASGARVTQRAKVEAADEQEQAFAELVARAKTRLVVAVDDIDRLSKDQILAALNAIRSFQLTCKKERQPIFIVSIDEEIVRTAIEEGESASTPDAQEFLNRLFTLRQEVPVHETFDLRDYARNLLTAQAPSLAAALGTTIGDVIMMLIHDDVTDPRHVVRLINAFSSDYRLARARELRTGARAIRDGLVTGHLDLLARVVVLKTDYPTFFRAILDNVDLIDMASRASSVDFPEEERLTLRDAGFDTAAQAHTSLYRYLSRTAGWGPEGVDLIPFLYLGQDRFSQTLGNVQARRVRSALANNQSAELVRLAGEASAAGADAARSFQELLLSVLRQLDPAEQSNAVAALLAVAASSETLRSPDLARAVAALIGRNPARLTDVRGAMALAPIAPVNSARILVSAILNVTDIERDIDVWRQREQLIKAVGSDRFQDWTTQRIASIGSWESLAAWDHDDLDDDAASGLLWQAVQLAASSEENSVADDTDLATVRSIARRVSSPRPPADEQVLKDAVARPADMYESAIALHASAHLDLTDKQLSALSYSMFRKSMGALDEDAEPLDEVRDEAAALAIRAATDAPQWGDGEKEQRISSAGVVADFVAGWITDSEFPASEGLPVLDAMVAHGAPGQTKLAVAIFTAWSEDPEGTDSAGKDLADVGAGLSRLADALDPLARRTVHDQWTSLFSLAGAPQTAALLVPTFLAHAQSVDWSDDALTALVPWFSTSYDFTGAPAEAATLILGAGRVTDAVEGQLVDALTTIAASGGTYRQRALAAASKLPWSAQALPILATNFERYIPEFDDEDFWRLLDLQFLRGTINPAFIAQIDNEIRTAAPNAAMVTRAKQLATQLPLESAVPLAIASGTESALTTIAARRHELADESAAETWAAILLEAGGAAVPTATRRTLAHILASADQGLYDAAVLELLDETLDSGGEKYASVWSYITLELRDSSRDIIRARVAASLLTGEREAKAACIVLAATQVDAQLDELLADDVREAMRHWVATVPNRTLAARMATAVGGSTHSRRRALSSWNRKPRIAERAAAYQAAADALAR
ncbi:MAG: KAP family NTPase [Microbacterium sp.]|uniref:P-loop NTPase fold protein n=1 Tax=Microbacterium sp. TaxID=51671 RepID=UPI002821B5FE|nr:P-loop NTPase fold protein [Microbacterium sp.]MDR2320018.1 KAP family NTPase [Microbacterium sp.]